MGNTELFSRQVCPFEMLYLTIQRGTKDEQLKERARTGGKEKEKRNACGSREGVERRNGLKRR